MGIRNASKKVGVTLFVTVAYGAIGFLDDYRKLTRRSSRGLSSRGKLVAQLAIGAVAAIIVVLLTRGPLATSFAVPFFKSLLGYNLSTLRASDRSVATSSFHHPPR